MKHHLFAVIFLLLPGGAQAQSLDMDSLWRVWSDTTRDIDTRGEALLKAFHQDSSLTVWQATHAALPTVTDTTSRLYLRERAVAKLARGQAYFFQGRVNDYVRLSSESLTDLKRAGDTLLEPRFALTIGYTFVEQGRFSDAIPYYMEALHQFESSRDTSGIQAVLSSIGSTSMQLGDVDRARQTYLRCLRLSEGRDPQLEFEALIRLASNFTGSGDTTGRHGYFLRAEALVRAGRATDALDEIPVYQVFKHLEAQECDRALARIEPLLAAELAGAFPTPNWHSFLLSLKTKAHVCAHRYREAIAVGREGLRLATEHGLLKEMLDNLKPLAEACEAAGEVREALRYTRRYQALKDSAATASSATRLAGTLLTADFEKQQLADSLSAVAERARDRLLAEQEVGRQRTQRNVLLGFGAFGLVFAAVDYRRRQRIKKEHARSEALLLNILPQEVADELKEKGHAEARHFDPATILFTDFKGFTRLSEQVTPAELIAELNTCFKAFDGIMGKYRIEKIKTIGDAYMAAGGVPDPRHGSPADVVRAALEMQDFMAKHRAERKAHGKPCFEMRVGIHSGPVVAGIVGVKKFQYDIWGDTVNTASRMESSGEVGRVNISEATYALVKDAPGLTFMPRGRVQAKGKGEMEMYFVTHA